MTNAELADLHARVFSVPRPWSETEIAALRGSAGVFLVQEPGAFLMGRALAGEAELLTLAVLPELRRQGLGTRLLNAFETEAMAAGAVSAFLEVAADNTAAQALYRNAGWRETGRRRAYYRTDSGTAMDALVMTKAIPGS